MTHDVTAKDLKVLTRRRDYLQGLGNEGNSYDVAEIKALSRVLALASREVEAEDTERDGSDYGID